MKKKSFDAMITMINEISTKAKDNKISRMFITDKSLNGRTINIEGQELVHFGSCGYLGLELDERIKEGAIDAIRNYGTFFVCSRTYAACGLYAELEDKLRQIFEAEVVIYPKVSQGHLNVMPIIIGENDMVIYDQQAHVSMQEASYKLQQLGVDITILRHNRMDDLEKKIIEYRSKYDKIWYVIDGMFSMFGDSPDYEALKRLQEKYKQLYLYIDDAHGTSWKGKNGSGYALSNIDLNERIILIASMTKAFGSTGGVFVFKDKTLYDRVESWGGSYTYAGPVESSTLGASIASAKIHLSNEIIVLQDKLKERIDYCYQLLEEHNIPQVSTSHSPIFYIAVGTTGMGYNMVKRLMNDGYFTNLGIYPAVPETCTGIRFTITNHLTFEDIKGLVLAIERNLPLALQEEKRQIKDIVRSFRKYRDFSYLLDAPLYNQHVLDVDALTLECYDTIHKVDSKQWDKLMFGKGAFTSSGLEMLEDTFINNAEKHNNWHFRYIIVKDHLQKVVLATFTTLSLGKDDMLSSAKVSMDIEEKRQDDAYYMTSQTLMLGSQLTNGEHLYVDKTHKHWKRAVQMLIEDLWKKQEESGANLLLMRDLDPDENDLCEVINDLGFAKLSLPDDNIIYSQGLSADAYFSQLNKKQRYKIRTEVLPQLDELTLVSEKCNTEELKKCYQLYLQTKERNMDVNTFDLPYKLFEKANNSEHWTILRYYHKSSSDPVSMGICYIHKEEFCPVIYGMNYNYNLTPNIYKKTIYLVIHYALEHGANIVHMGIGADATKHMFGSSGKKRIGYAILKDNYNMMLLDSMEE